LKANFLAVLNTLVKNKDLINEELKKSICQTISNRPNKEDEIKEVLAGLDKIADKKSRLSDMHLDGLIKLAEYKKSYVQYEKQ
jgi:hypothetical protein